MLVVASTHGHEGPDTLGLWGPGRFTSGVDPRVPRPRAADDRGDGGRGARPDEARASRPREDAHPGLIEDGRLPKVIDDTLVAMQVVGQDGATLGTVINWSSHPEALGGKNTARHVGLPALPPGPDGGAARRDMRLPRGLDRRAHDAAGAEADRCRRQAVPADSFALAQAVGERAADAALEALKAGRPSASSALEHRSATVFVPLQNRIFRLAMFLGVLDRQVFSGGRPATTLFGDDFRTEIGYLRLGDAEALLVPAEIYPELGARGIQDPQDPGADFPGAPRERALFTLLDVGVQARPRPRQRRDRLRDPALAVGREGALRLRAEGGPVRRDQLGRPGVAAHLAEAFARLLAR